MMQQESEHDMLREKLYAPDTQDLIAGWDKNAAWERLEKQLHPPYKRIIPLWSYGTAAAALLLLGVFIFKQNKTGEAPVIARQSSGMLPAAASGRSVVPQASHPENSHTHAAVTLNQKRPPKPVLKDMPLLPLAPAPVNTQTVRQEDVPAVQIATVNPVPIRKTFTEPVYTLNEIMDEVPEKEMPPRTYSGIFNLQPADTKNDEPARGSRLFHQQNQQALFEGNY